MIPVDQALTNLLNLIDPLDTEMVSLANAGGRVLATDQVAHRDQPPFASSAMDGYAVQSADLSTGAVLTVIGESAAGSRFEGAVTAGQAVRIFTGAPVPEGADKILIQEDTDRNGSQITVRDGRDTAVYIRPAGGDFKQGMTQAAPCLLGPSEISLLASMNIPNVPVHRKPEVALIATGDELVMPGGAPNKDQIISSNNFGLKAMVEAAGGIARILPIARDTEASLRYTLSLAQDTDIIVTLGGASVGDHDLVQKVASDTGLDLSFYKVAMRPGKPLMAGKYNGTPMLGLPGNPVSSLVCGHVFLRPMLAAMQGLGKSSLPTERAILAEDIGSNGPRSHYLRAKTELTDGHLNVRPFDRQDSSLLTILAHANALMVRPPNDPAQKAGTTVEIIRL